MYDMKPLEEEWLKYQAKKRKPIYLFFIFLLAFLLVFFFIFQKNINFNFLEKYFTNASKISSLDKTLYLKDKNQHILINKALQRIEVLELQSNVIPIENNTVISDISTDILVDIPILNEKSENITYNNDNKSRKKVHLDIIETTSISAYEDVAKRFHQSHDIDDALFLAKSYYKKGNYKKAEEWAIESNKLDSELKESFFIFVKAKMKLGKKNEARAILNQYLKHNNSKDARVLLNQIENSK